MEITKVGTADLLIKIGVRADLLGFEYMVDILEICLQDPNLIHGGMMKLYKMVSAKHNVSYINVESRIRNAIEITFEQGIRRNCTDCSATLSIRIRQNRLPNNL